MFPLDTSRLLTLHFIVFQTAIAMGGGFVGAYLIKFGLGLPGALLAYAALLACRGALRFCGLFVVRLLGFKGALVGGAVLGALQFAPLALAQSWPGVCLWLFIAAVAESLYWPVYHASVVVTGDSDRTGRDIGLRTALGAVIGIAGPFAGGLLLAHFGAAVDFGVASVLILASALPLLRLGTIDAGPVPTGIISLDRLNPRAMLAFSADGWIASALGFAWPMALFLSVGMRFDSLGLANGLAGLFGAVAGLLCGRAVDRGGREKFLKVVCAALCAGLALRAGSSWAPSLALVANATGAVVGGLYAPVLMSAIYETSRKSGAAYEFHFAAEAGWDLGAILGCLTGAAVVSLTHVPSFGVLHAALGVGVLYACIRPAPAPALEAEPCPALN